MNKLLSLAVLGYLTQPFTSLADNVVKGIDIDYQGPKTVTPAYIRSHLGILEGNVISSVNIDQAIQNLYKTGFFKDVQILEDEREAGQVYLKVCVQALSKIRHIKFKGNKQFKNNALLAEIKSRSNSPLDAAKIKNDIQLLLKFYEKKGYLKTQISYTILEPENADYRDLVFQVNEGIRYQIKEICFWGNKNAKSKELLEIMKTKTWDLFSFITNTGRYHPEQIENDLESLRNFYRNKGYLDVRVLEPKIIEQKRSLIVNIPIKEGPIYRINHINVSTDDDTPVALLNKKLAVKEGAIFTPISVEKTIENIKNFYGQYGYIDTQVNVNRDFLEGNKVDLNIQIVRGQQAFIKSLYITGNRNTKSRVILRELNLAPGDVCDRVRIQNAEARLQNTGLFEMVNVQTEDTNISNQKNLHVDVSEAKTGSLFFSGAVNSEEKFTFGITFSESNFDYKNPKNYFRGAGQKFQMGLSLGKYSNNIDISFEEPWLFDRELRFGFNLFRNVNKYDNNNYTKKLLGGEVYLGKRLFEQVQGRLYYRLEEFNLSNIKIGSVSPIIAAEKGSRSSSKVGFMMSRDTRNHFFYPTEGSLLELDNQMAGGICCGQTNYVRSRFTAAKWFLVNPNYEQVFLCGGKTGTVRGFGGKEVSLFEREFLGGTNDLRGFDGGDVGPKTSDKFHDCIGGKTFGFIKTEYSFKVHNLIRLVGFYDAGFVNKETGNWSVSDYNSDWGVGVRIHVMGVPFRIDFAFPLKTDKYNKNKGPVITYSFGVSF